jgi:hypothetical protein
MAPLLVLAWRAYTVRTARRRAWFWALVSVSVTTQTVGALCFRYPIGISDWGPADFIAAVRQSPVAAAVICLVGYFVAAFVFRKITTRHPVDTPAHVPADEPAHAKSAVG